MGLSFDDSKLEFLSELLIRRAERQGLELDCYLDRLEGLDTDSELQNLALELTVPETYFFRHIEQLHAFADVALPDARAARAPLRKINVLCVGCASGEEPYSLAILIRERYSEFTSSVAIRAVDINTAMLTKAARGCYSAWALRETSSETQRRWFRSVGREFVLEESIRDAVTFQEINLAHENADSTWPMRARSSNPSIACMRLQIFRVPASDWPPVSVSWIVTADEVPDPHSLRLQCFVNGEVRQASDTGQMIFNIWQQIAYLSTAFTLESGDLLATGTPEGVGVGMQPPRFLQPGDVVRCEIERIGVIENHVRRPSA